MSRPCELSAPRRIEMILPALPLAGMEMVVARLAFGLIGRGHDVGVTCLEASGPVAEMLAERGIHVEVVPAPGLRGNIAAPTLARWLRSRRLDVVHSHSGTWLKAARAARHAGVPRVVHTVHGLLTPEPWHGPLLMRAAARHTDVIVAVSEPLARYLSRVCPSAASRVRVVINGVDCATFAPHPAGIRAARAAVAGEWAGDPLVGHVARLAPVKNQAMLLRAFHHVVTARPNARLIIAGDGPLRDELTGLAEGLGIAGNVRFAGEVRDMPQFLRALDAFVLSSDAEGTPMCLLEAMATGTPVVSTAVGGIPDLLDHGHAGLLVRPNDAAAMSMALLELLRDPGHAASLAAAGRARCLSSYSEAEMIATYEAAYARPAPVRQVEEVFACAE